MGRVTSGKVEEGVAGKESGKGVVGGKGREAGGGWKVGGGGMAAGGRDQGQVVEGEGEPGGVQEREWRQ